MHNDELYEPKYRDKYDCSKGDYIYYKHRRYGYKQYTYVGLVTEVWFPDCINGSCRFITITLVYTDDDSLNINTGEETSVNTSDIGREKDDVFEIITKEQAVTKAL